MSGMIRKGRRMTSRINLNIVESIGILRPGFGGMNGWIPVAGSAEDRNFSIVLFTVH